MITRPATQVCSAAGSLRAARMAQLPLNCFAAKVMAVTQGQTRGNRHKSPRRWRQVNLLISDRTARCAYQQAIRSAEES